MAKHVKMEKWKWAILLVAACLLVAAAGFGLWQLWPDSPEQSETPTTTTLSTVAEKQDGSASLEESPSTEESTSTDASASGKTEESTTAEETTTTAEFTTTTAAPKVELSVTSHEEGTTTTDEPLTTFTGTSDPKHSLKINGKEVERDEDGAFSLEYALSPGNNEFVFSHKGKTTTYIVHYNYVVMQSYTPSGGRRYRSGATFSVLVSARVGSTVTATFQGQTITLSQTTGQGGDGDTVKSDTFIHYTGTFKLPRNNAADKDMGVITFKASYNGVTNTGSSGTIVCKKAEVKVIGEVVAFSAETFDGDKNDDDSRPTNNYFPKGTVDYVVGRTYFGDKEYLLLRCGRRVYVEKELSPPKQTVKVTREYAGTLPDTNRLSLDAIRVTAGATYVTLNTNWKAPFFLDIHPQSYKNPAIQDYRITGVTAQYVEITFCYATAVTGNFTFDKHHPLFSRATVEKAGKNTVLRLYLQREGGFYGWDAYYNDKGQLEFYFLHPAQVKASNNAYGADLRGVTIMLDVGHGYTSGGASGLDSAHPEGERNYYLATLIKKELESIGATVILNRTATGDLDQDQRCLMLKRTKPDLCIAVHHDANNSSRPNGFGSFYSLPYTYPVAKYIYDATMATGIYKSSTPGNNNRLGWHYYFVSRMSDCPVVLTENGYMSSRVDHRGIVSDLTNWKKAKAIVKGVAQYFLSIRIAGYRPPATTTVATTRPTAITTTTGTTVTTTRLTTAPTVTTTTKTAPVMSTTTTTTTSKTTKTTTKSTTKPTTTKTTAGTTSTSRSKPVVTIQTTPAPSESVTETTREEEVTTTTESTEATEPSATEETAESTTETGMASQTGYTIP